MATNYSYILTVVDEASYQVELLLGTYIKGDQGDAGNGIANITTNADGTLTITMDDGATYTTQPLQGNGIASAVLNADYTLTLTFTDGTSYTTPSIRGEQGATGATGAAGADGADGADGVGIASAVLNPNYTLTLTFTDGTSYTTPSIRGAQGAKGDTGDEGPQGVGISNVVLNADYTLTVTLTNGVTYTSPSIRGAEGPQGVQGPQGPAGQGVPTGGTAGQILAKDSGTDYDAHWIDAPNGVFAVTHNTTTYAEIAAAFNAGKFVFINDDAEGIMPLVGLTELEATFIGFSSYGTEVVFYATCSSADVWGGGYKILTDAYKATYGTTAYSDAYGAYSAGMVVYCEKDGVVYYLTSIATDLVFTAFDGTTLKELRLTSGDVWSNGSTVLALADTDAVQGNLAEFDASGNPVDSGIPSDNVAQKDGYYATLIAGAAENLVGRGSVEAEYTRRTSGGTADIGSGTAEIAALKGNSVVWNQLAKGGNYTGSTVYGITRTTISTSCVRVSGTSEQSTTFTLTDILPFISGHKYYAALVGMPSTCRISLSGFIGTYSKIVTANSVNFGIYIPSGVQISADIYVVWTDLTLMFGSGNEPSTVAEFEELYPLPYYAYNAGEIVNNKATTIQTVGFNQFDKSDVTEGKTLYDASGLEVNAASSWISGWIPAFPNTQYYVTHVIGLVSGYAIHCYDANKVHIAGRGVSGYSYDESGSFTTPAETAYIRLRSTLDVGYENVCLNLSWSGWRNGEYEAYWKSQLALNIPTLTGKLNGEGSSVTICADGLKSAGSVYDEGVVEDGYLTKIIKRVWSVDLGTLTWEYQSTYGFATSTLYDSIKKPSSISVVPNLLPEAYDVVNFSKLYNGGTSANYISVYTNGAISVSSALTDATAFAAAVSGININYELATPLTYVLDTPIYVGYRVDDFGTEERLPADTSSAVTAPIRYSVKYAMNAADTIRRLGTNYIKKESMDAILTAMQTAGIIASYTLTYDSTNDDYDCTITAPSE